MMTPFGPSIAGPFATKDDFYQAYPHIAGNWRWQDHPGRAPLGYDLKSRGPEKEDWLLTFCYPQSSTTMSGPKATTTGVVVAFNRSTGESWVLDDPIDFASAKAKY